MHWMRWGDCCLRFGGLPGISVGAKMRQPIERLAWREQKRASHQRDWRGGSKDVPAIRETGMEGAKTCQSLERLAWCNSTRHK